MGHLVAEAKLVFASHRMLYALKNTTVWLGICFA